MPKIAKIILADEVNALVTGIDPATKKALDKHLCYFVPGAFHMPKYKAGVWDGRVHLFSDGWTYVNLLDEAFLNIIISAGYQIEVIDQRRPETVHFDPVGEDWLENVKLRDYQQAAVNITNEHSNGILLMATGAGKAQPLTAKVRTPDGVVEIGSLKTGDRVLTVDGRVTMVTGVFPQGEKHVVRMNFKDGRSVECCEEHLWKACQNDWQPRTKNNFRVITAAMIREHLSTSKRPIYVPLCGASAGPTAVDFDPYLLGLLLGDGSITKQQIRFSSADAFLVQQVAERLPIGMSIKKIMNTKYDHVISNNTRNRFIKNSVRESLRSMGLLGTNSYTKFIPGAYKTATFETRLALIQGLFDTDGTVDKNGCVSFCTTSQKLAHDVRSLIWSIGGICRMTEKHPKYRYNGELRDGVVAYVLNIRHPTPEILFRLPRKRERILGKPYQYGGDVLKLQVTSVEDVGIRACVCISVADESRLYLTEDYVVTHNTNICAGITKAFLPHGKVITVVPQIDLVTGTAETYHRVGVPDVGVFYGEEKTIAQATVTTWQSLVNRPEILGGTVALILDEAHKYAAKEMFNLLKGPAGSIHHRYGFTGTLPKNELTRLQLLAGIGPVIFSKSAYELQQEGHLSSCHIHVMETQEPDDPKGVRDVYGAPFLDHEEEFHWLLNDPGRLDWLAETIKTISATGNTLVLMRYKATSDGLAKRLEKAIQVDGRVESDDRIDIYKAINTEKDAILLATKGVASTGIDITHIYNVVLVEAGKSFTEVIQMIGRGLRKGGEKDHVDVWDICASTPYSKIHSRERKKYYLENKYPFNVIKVPRLTSAKEMFG